jgi:cobalt/nickel transport system permease protein
LFWAFTRDALITPLRGFTARIGNVFWFGNWRRSSARLDFLSGYVPFFGVHRYDLHFNQAEGMRALQIGLRAWAATSVTLLFAFTTSIAQVSNLLRRIRVPSGLVELIGLTYYSLFRLDDSLEKLLTAQRQRLGYRNFTLSLRSTGQAISALFLRSVRQSIRWELGLTARGYHGQLRVLLPPSETRFYHNLAALGVVLGILVLTTLGRI